MEMVSCTIISFYQMVQQAAAPSNPQATFQPQLVLSSPTPSMPNPTTSPMCTLTSSQPSTPSRTTAPSTPMLTLSNTQVIASPQPGMVPNLASLSMQQVSHASLAQYATGKSC